MAGDIGIFQHYHFTPGQQGGKKQYHDKAEILTTWQRPGGVPVFNQLWFSIFVSCCTLTTPNLLFYDSGITPGNSVPQNSNSTNGGMIRRDYHSLQALAHQAGSDPAWC
ncbi:hypothetical protein ACLB1S_18215 [Escherichia coli]